MPKTLPELSKDVADIQTRMGEKDVRDAKIDNLLEIAIKQSEKFETAVTQFQDALTSHRIALDRVQYRVDSWWKVLGVLGSILLVALGTVLGQVVHFHP